MEEAAISDEEEQEPNAYIMHKAPQLLTEVVGQAFDLRHNWPRLPLALLYPFSQYIIHCIYIVIP